MFAGSHFKKKNLNNKFLYMSKIKQKICLNLKKKKSTQFKNIILQKHKMAKKEFLYQTLGIIPSAVGVILVDEDLEDVLRLRFLRFFLLLPAVRLLFSNFLMASNFSRR